MNIKRNTLAKLLVFSAVFTISYAINPINVIATTLEKEVYRFYSPGFKSHFYTISQQEKDFIIENDPNWSFEGIAYSSFAESQEDTVPLYRFYSDIYNSHFYTKSTAEKDFIIENNANWEYEGIAYYVQSAGAPIYRFYSPNFQSHFYTTSLQERDFLIESDSNWLYEGIAFYTEQSNMAIPEEETPDNAIVESSCGIDHGQSLIDPPSNPLCQNDLTAADQTGSGPWLWTCRDSSGALVSTCRAELEGAQVDVQGQCGDVVNVCAIGVFIDTQDSSSQHLWGCIGSGGFATFVECSLDK